MPKALTSISKLSLLQHNKILELYKEGVKQADIADRFDITQATVSRIVKGSKKSRKREANTVDYKDCLLCQSK